MFDIIVNTNEELKKIEMYMFTLIFPFEFRGTISVLNTGKSYYYKTQRVDNGYTIVTC